MIRVIPYSAVQLFAYETYKVVPKLSLCKSYPLLSLNHVRVSHLIESSCLWMLNRNPSLILYHPYNFRNKCPHFNLQKLFRGKDGELSVIGRLAAGACAGMTSTFVSNAVVY